MKEKSESSSTSSNKEGLGEINEDFTFGAVSSSENNNNANNVNPAQHYYNITNALETTNTILGNTLEEIKGISAYVNTIMNENKNKNRQQLETYMNKIIIIIFFVLFFYHYFIKPTFNNY